MRRKRQYIVLSFASTARAMGWEKECAARGIPGRLIPLPSEITAGCGLGWRMLPEDWQGDVTQALAAGAPRTELARVVLDYVAGMTDRFCIQEYYRLISPEDPAAA